MRRVMVGLVVLGLSFVTMPEAGAAPAPVWSRWFPMQAGGLDVSPSGLVVVVGNTTDEYPGGSMLLRAFRPDGSLAWGSSWEPAQAKVRASDVDATASAVFTSGVIARPHGGEIGIFGWLVRRATGTTWIRTPDGWREGDTSASGAVGAGGGIVAIDTTQLIEGYPDIHAEVRAFDTEGRTRWVNPFEPFPVTGDPGYDADDVNAIAVDDRGRTYAAGWAWRRARMDPPFDQEAALIALGPDGTRRWVKVLGEHGTPRQGDTDRGVDVEVRGEHVVFASSLDKGGDRTVARIIDLATGGWKRWSRAFPIERRSTALQAAPGASGVVYVADVRPRTPSGNDLVIRKLGADGSTIWYRRLPTARPVDLAVGAGGLYVLTHHRLWRFPA